MGHTQFFARVLENLGDVSLDALTPDLLRAWQQRLSQQYKPSTVHKYIVRLGGAVRFGVACGWLTVDPLRDIRTPSPGQGRVRFLSQEERIRLLAACRKSRNPHLYALVALGTGGGKDEVRCLCWPAVAVDAGVVRFAQTTTSLERAVPLLGEALILLKERSHCRKLRIPWVFPRPDGRQPTPLASPWQTARASAGIEDFHFNDLRHTYASYLAMSGATVQDIAALLGHKNIQQTLMYAALMPTLVETKHTSHDARCLPRRCSRWPRALLRARPAPVAALAFWHIYGHCRWCRASLRAVYVAS